MAMKSYSKDSYSNFTLKYFPYIVKKAILLTDGILIAYMNMNIQERMGTMTIVLMNKIVVVCRIIDEMTQHKQKKPAEEWYMYAMKNILNYAKNRMIADRLLLCFFTFFCTLFAS